MPTLHCTTWHVQIYQMGWICTNQYAIDTAIGGTQKNRTQQKEHFAINRLTEGMDGMAACQNVGQCSFVGKHHFTVELTSQRHKENIKEV